jgi:Na+-transporting methylmalonyl-CoA/oxaloacetate decarboxylase beta subunit
MYNLNPRDFSYVPLSFRCVSVFNRCFDVQLFIPFAFAILFLISHQYELDPILVFLGQSESTPFRTLTIREPYVKRLLLGRAIWVTTLVAICVVALTLIFWAVPGHRL